jgi:cation:H+ antiporter
MMTPLWIWLQFLASAALIVFAATQLAKYGDVIAIRTKLGGMFVGVLLLAGATSLPELLTTISSIYQGVPNMAAGNLLGSNLFNMFLLAILDLAHRKERILRKAAMKHALSGSLAVFLIGLVVFFVITKLEWQVGWVGVDSLLIILAYVFAIRLIHSNQTRGGSQATEIVIPIGTPSLGKALIGFGLAVAGLVIVTPWMVHSSAQIAEITGLGTTFVGTTLVAIVTSLPEMVTTLAAAKLGADDMAIGNLFGSNLFNMFALGLTDLFYLNGNFLSIIDPAFLLVGMLGLLMTSLGLIGNLARLERRVLFVELDALALIAMYFSGLLLLYTRGTIP